MGCSKKESFPAVLSLEDSIREIIVSKSESYDFLSDQLYVEYMGRLGRGLVTNPESYPAHYSLGHLDEDNIPELLVFKERDPGDLNDQGSLEVYRFNGESYVLLDRVPMNYDNTNHQMVIGKIAKDTRGILLSNGIGAHSAMTYGFVLEEGKLKSIFDENKVSLISIYADNEIKDMDGDGVLEFSVYTIDPETLNFTVEDSDKMKLWYRWNGRDGASLVEVERMDLSLEGSNEDIFHEAMVLIGDDLPLALNYMIENRAQLSRYHNVELLKAYIDELMGQIHRSSMEIDNLFSRYQDRENFDYLFEKYGLSLEKINSIEYLSREKTLRDEEEIKEDLVKGIRLGYRLDLSEGGYFYRVDYQRLLDIFDDHLTSEYRDYLKILALDSNEAFMRDGSLIISTDKLIDRILLAESFKIVYPYSEFLEEVLEIYYKYLQAYFYGDLHSSNYDSSQKLRDEARDMFEKTVERYSYTNFGNMVAKFLEALEGNAYIVDDSLRQVLKNILE